MRQVLLALIFCGGLFTQALSGENVSKMGAYNLPGKPPYLVMHYIQWYSTPWSTIDGEESDHIPRNWNHWRWRGKEANHDPERRLPDGRRDIASTVYPLIGVYDSGSRAVVRYHLATAKAAGVEVVAALWYGPGHPTDLRLPIVMEEAEKLDMRIMICYEEKINFPGYRHPQSRNEIVQNTTADFQYILSNYASQPVYLRRNGLPVIMQFNGHGTFDLGRRNLSPEEFQQVFNALPTPLAYIRQNLHEEYHPTIPAAYVWFHHNDWPERFAKRAAEIRQEGKLAFSMSMVCPGFDDTGVWGWGNGPRKSNGYGMEVLRWTFDRALAGDPELVQLVTWNDFNESTCFEPTVEYGFQFLDALEQWWGKKTGRPVNLRDNRGPFQEYQRSSSEVERAEILPLRVGAGRSQ